MPQVIDRYEFQDAIFNNGLDLEIYDDYSGRAMYGKECVGVVGDLGDFAMFCAAIGSTVSDWEWVRHARQDSMGMKSIFYFPGVQIEPKGESDEEDES